MSSDKKLLIGITGGIGAGKSVVSRILRLRGFAVYDCDIEARRLMDASQDVKELLLAEIGELAFTTDGELNRGAIAERLFNDSEFRTSLNTLVHGLVRDHLRQWAKAQTTSPVFVESAILASSGLADMCDKVILVDAPEDLRIERALARGGITAQDARARIETQRQETAQIPKERIIHIENSGSTPLLMQLS